MHVNKSINIIELQYFGTINWFSRLVNSTHSVFLKNERFKKMSYRNRCIVTGSLGTINLSVPLENGRNQKSEFGKVKVSYSENWQASHWHTIVSCYGKSPYFEYYRDGLQNFFINPNEFLFEHNLAILDWLKITLKLPLTYEVLEKEQITNGEEISDFSDFDLPKNFKNVTDFPIYPQVFEDRTGFIPNLSILDLLFNCGPYSLDILKKIP